VSADIETSLVPLSTAAAGLLARGVIGLEALISGGDDYEILCAVAPPGVAAFMQEAARAGVAIAEIGTITAQSQPPRFLDAQGHPIRLQRLSYSHF
jgi:thiamine-monophosphate kinase